MNQFTFYANKPTQNYHKVDMWLFASMLLLWGFGIFTLFVCSQTYAGRVFDDELYFVKRQLIYSVAGFAAFFVLLAMDIKLVRKFVSIIVIVTLVLCFLTFIPGISITRNGARRWLRLPGSFTFQPSELVKFAIVLFLALQIRKKKLCSLVLSDSLFLQELFLHRKTFQPVFLLQ